MLNPAEHAEQMPWVRDARRRLPRDVRAGMQHFRFFFSPTAELFPRAWRDSENQDFDQELRILRGSPGMYRDAVLRRLIGSRLISAADLESMRRPRRYSAAAETYAARHPESRAMLQQFVDSPIRSLRLFCDMLAAFQQRVVQPTWGSIQSRLLEDIVARRRVFRTYGMVPLLRTLSSDIVVSHGRRGAAVDFPFEGGDLHLDARGRLVLVPSFFCWPRIESVMLKTPHGVRCIIAYPLPPLPAKITRIPNADDIVACCTAVGNGVRIRIVELLNGRELSTRELAGYLKISEPLVSRHLRQLFDAGLLQRRRSGYFVLYSLRRERIQRLIDSLKIASTG